MAFIVLVIVIRLIIQILAQTLGVVRKLPLIKITDRYLGAILGFLEIYLIVFVVLYLVTVLPTPDWKIAIFKDSVLPDYIIQNTPILSKQFISLFFNK